MLPFVAQQASSEEVAESLIKESDQNEVYIYTYTLCCWGNQGKLYIFHNRCIYIEL